MIIEKRDHTQTDLDKYLMIDNLINQIEKNIDVFIKKTHDNKQDEKIAKDLSIYIEQSTSGSPYARNTIKKRIQNYLLDGFSIYVMDEEKKRLTDDIEIDNVHLTEKNGYIDKILLFQEPERLDAREKFEILLYHFKDIAEDGRDRAFFNMKNKYPIYENIKQEEQFENIRYEYTEENIEYIYANEDIHLTFADKLEIITQLIYSEKYGLKCLDSLAYAFINEVGLAKNGEYIFVWRDDKIRLKFLQLRYGQALKVLERSIQFDESAGEINAGNPEVLCERGDGARITALMPPYSATLQLRIRIFDKDQATVHEIVPLYKLKVLLIMLIKLGEKIIFQGGLGTGKSTMMSTAFEVLDDCLHIGLIEDVREQHLLRRFKDKCGVELSILSGIKTLADAVKTILRMSVDIADIGEMREGNAVYTFIQLVQSVSICAFSTAHMLSPKNTIPRLMNMVMGTGIYKSEQTAVMNIIHSLNIVVQHGFVNGKRMITEVTEIIPLADTYSHVDFRNAKDEELQRMVWIQELQKNPANMYMLNTLYDAKDGKPKLVGYPSERMMDKLMLNKKLVRYVKPVIEEIKKDTLKEMPEYIKRVMKD